MWCSALFGSVTPAVSKRWNLHRTVLLSLTLILIGVAARPFTTGAAGFVLLTGVATAGAAFGNVALPALARAYFPGQVALVSSLFGAALVAGNTVASVTTVPLSTALGGWEPALGAWALLALLASLALRPRNSALRAGSSGLPARLLVKSPLA